MTETPSPEPKAGQGQLYDSTIKMLVADQTLAVLSHFTGKHITSAREVKTEIFKEGVVKPGLRVDCLYLVTEEGRAEEFLVHIEFEASPSPDIEARMLEYLGLIFRKYRQGIIQVVVLPFEGKNLPLFPLVIRVGDVTTATLNCGVVALPLRSAQAMMEQGLVELYAWLPTMEGATSERLRQALQAMKAYYAEQTERFHNHVLWFDTFLRRSPTMTEEDKKSILDEMSGFDTLLDEGYFVTRRKAEMLAKGRVEGKAEGLAEGLAEGEARGEVKGRVEGLQEAVVTLIELRFPPLKELAEQKIPQIRKREQLDVLFKSIYNAPDEATVRTYLTIAA